MKEIHLLIITLFICMIACKPKDTTTTSENTTPAPDTTSNLSAADREIPSIKQMWETPRTLTTSESVYYDKTNNVLYVSCINGAPPDKKDGDGYIARVGLDGKIITDKWLTGLSGPKGMAMVGNTLYVTDIDRLVSFDVTTGKMLKDWKVKDAQFLNDVTASEDGTVYFSDSNTSSIYALKGGTTVEPFVLSDGTLGGVNGLFYSQNLLITAGIKTGDVFAMDLTSKNVKPVASGVGAGDGVERYKNGWLVSNWNGEVYYIASTGEVTEVIDSQEAKMNAADIEVIEEKNMLLVPTFFGNSVAAYELVSQ